MEKITVKVMNRLAIALTVLLAVAARAAGQVPGDGLAAEGERRWQDALQIYETTVRDHPERADVWVRISDIRAHLGNQAGSIEALYAATKAAGDDPELFARLSRAYATAGQPVAALAAIEGALALRPRDRAFLQAAGELAAWNAAYPQARAAYRTLVAIAPANSSAWLALARVENWSGHPDRAVRGYRSYLSRVPDDSAAWLEWARAESFRGNDAGAREVLEQYGARFGDNAAYRRELASVLARGDRPHGSLRVLRPLLAGAPDDYDLNLTHSLALVQAGDGDKATRGYQAVRRLGPERAETIGLKRQLRIAFGSAFQPSSTAYADSDGLRHYRVPLFVSVAVTPTIRLQAGYEKDAVSARVGSGLDAVDAAPSTTSAVDGRSSLQLDRGWAGAEISVWPGIVVRGHAGRQQSDVRDEWTYEAGTALRIGDHVRLLYDREHGLMTISPRAVSLGLARDFDRLRATVSPTFSCSFDVDASIETISDDNQRTSLRLSPHVSVVRDQFLNLDLGASAYVFSADRNLDHGYYDPDRYQAYSFTVLPYVKFAESAGLSLFIEAGIQKDEQQQGFEPGGSAAAELTLGIYRAWVLKVTGSATVNSRLESGAYRGFGTGAALTRRF